MDNARSGYIHSQTKAVYPCADLRRYCQHGTYGPTLRKNCKRSCGVCKVSGAP